MAMSHAALVITCCSLCRLDYREGGGGGQARLTGPFKMSLEATLFR